MTPLSSMTKRYILKKDLPGNKAGTIFRWHKMTGGYAPELDNDSFNDDVLHSFPKEWVENDTDGFFEEEKPERIHVDRIYLNCGVINGGGIYAMLLSKQVPEERFQAIKEAIERCLNGDDRPDGCVEFADGRWFTKDELRQYITRTFKNECVYSQGELDEAQKLAWDAAREVKLVGYSSDFGKSGKHINKYNSFEDYKNKTNDFRR